MKVLVQTLLLLGSSLLCSGDAAMHRQLADASPPASVGNISCYVGTINLNGSSPVTPPELDLETGFSFCGAWLVAIPEQPGMTQKMYQGFGNSEDGPLESCSRYETQLKALYLTQNFTLAGFYCCDTSACNTADRAVTFAPKPPSPPPVPALPPFPPTTPGAAKGLVSCFVGIPSINDTDYSASVALYAGFSYCFAWVATPRAGTGLQGEQSVGYAGQVTAPGNSKATCDQALNQLKSGYYTGSNGATITGFYCCATDACNTAERPIVYAPKPPSPPNHPPMPPFPPGPPGSISCYLGLDGLNNTDYNTDVILNPGFSYCTAVALTATVVGTDTPATAMLFNGVVPNANGKLDTCGQTHRLYTETYVKDTVTISGFYCCHAQACNSPEKSILYTPPPPAIKKKPHPPPPCKTVKPSPKRKSPRQSAGRRMAA